MPLKTSLGRNYQPEDCGVLAIEHPVLRPDTHVIVGDHSYNLPENDFNHNRFERQPQRPGGARSNYYLLTFPADDLPGDHVLVTDRVLPSGSVRDKDIPLFYQYTMRWDHYSPNGDFGAVELKRFSDGAILPKNEYQVEYSNFTYFDPPGGILHERWATSGASGTYNKLRVLLPEYVVRAPEGPWKIHYSRYLRGQTEYDHSEFVNATPLFRDDLDYKVEWIAGTDQPKHSIIEIDGTAGSQIYTLSGHAFAKKADWARIHVEHPVGTEWDEWNPRVFGGSLVYNRGDRQLVYNTQFDINHSHPTVTASGDFKKAYNDVGARIDTRNIQLSIGPVDFRHSGYPDYTPDPNPSGENYGIKIWENGTAIDNRRIKDWNAWDNIITLDRTHDFATYTASYLFENRWFFLTGVDMNPRRRKVKDFRRWTNKLSDDSIEANPLQIMIVPRNHEMPRGGPLRLFFDYLSVHDHGVAYSADVRDRSKFYLPSSTFAIADVLSNSMESSQLIVTDVRSRGGGVRQKHLNKMIEPEFLSDYGVWDGIALRGEGIIIIQIPLSKRDTIIQRFYDQGWLGDAGARMADDFIHTQIEKFLPAGALYFIFDENGNRWPRSVRQVVRYDG